MSKSLFSERAFLMHKARQVRQKETDQTQTIAAQKPTGTKQVSQRSVDSTHLPLYTQAWGNLPPSWLRPTALEQAPDEEKSVTGNAEPIQNKQNATGLPEPLQTGIETLSGLAMDDVQVHYNSSKPSEVQALAYTQGTDIHLGPGQEQHLPHEAWHVVQQKQGRVQPTLQAKGVAINDDVGLEREADIMSATATRRNSKGLDDSAKIIAISPLQTGPIQGVFWHNKQEATPNDLDAIEYYLRTFRKELLADFRAKRGSQQNEGTLAAWLRENGIYTSVKNIIGAYELRKEEVPEKEPYSKNKKRLVSSSESGGSEEEELFEGEQGGEEEGFSEGEQGGEEEGFSGSEEGEETKKIREIISKLKKDYGLSTDKFMKSIKYLSEYKDPSEIFTELKGYDWLAIHRRLLELGQLRLTPVKKGSAKMTRNRVKAAISLVVEDQNGDQRTIIFVIPKDFVSGESNTQKKVETWVNKIGRGPYLSEKHAHSEQDMGVYLREIENLAGITNLFHGQMKEGETAIGVILDFVSYPNTVCPECFPSIDETMYQVVMPYFQRFFKNENMQGVINASAAEKFKGSSDKQPNLTWIETIIDYDQIKKQEKSERQKERRNLRSERGEKRAKKSSRDVSLEERKEGKRPNQNRIRELASNVATVHVVNGIGLNCYIRSILTGLAVRGVIAVNQIENLVATIADQLVNEGLRVNEAMIDAGGIAAAEVRRIIAELTSHIVDGGIDVGINIIQWDTGSQDFTFFTANQGTYQLTLLYTPGHFDFLDI